MRTQKITIAICILVFSALLAAQEQPIAITGGTVVIGNGTTLANGTVIISGGRIIAVGVNVPIPNGAKVINAKGMTVWPGMIDPYTTLGMAEVGADRSTNDSNEATSTNTAQMRASDGIDPDSDPIMVTRISGVTTALVSPGQANPINGQAAIIDLSGRTVHEMLVRDPVALIFNFGAKRDNSYPSTHPGIVAFIRQSLYDAQGYLERTGKGDKENGAKNAGVNLQSEALAKALKGELPVFALTGNAQDILNAIQVATEFKLKLVLVNPREAWKVLGEIKAAGFPVVHTATFAVPGLTDRYDRYYSLAAAMHAAGVPFAFSTGSNHNTRQLAEHAAMSVTFGLPREFAEQALTLQAAKILGIDADYGSLENGKVANVVVWNGDPLQLTSKPVNVFIRGIEIPLVSRQELLRDKYEKQESVH